MADRGTKQLRDRDNCRWDAVSLGEVSLSLDAGERRIRTARTFEVEEGGGEYHVARGLTRSFRQRTAIVTALVYNEIGRLLEELVLTGGVDTSLMRWLSETENEPQARNGLSFVERGSGVREPVTCRDHDGTAVKQLRVGDVDWDRIFGVDGARWFHTGGAFTGLSESSADLALDAMVAARRHGVVVSYDLRGLGGAGSSSGAQRAMASELARHADVIVGDEEEFAALFGVRPTAGLAVSGTGATTSDAIVDAVVSRLEDVQLFALRRGKERSRPGQDWHAVGWSRCEGVVWSTGRHGSEVLDGASGSDGFAAGLIYGLLHGHTLQTAVELGVAHGALAMTTPGAASATNLAEVVRLARSSPLRRPN